MLLLLTVYIVTIVETCPIEHILFKMFPADLLNSFPLRRHLWITDVSKHVGWTAVTTASQNDWLTLTACDFKQHFVIEAQSELRHSRQDHFELDGSNNFTPQDAAIGAHLRVKEA